jgi:hypothetical protein
MPELFYNCGTFLINQLLNKTLQVHKQRTDVEFLVFFLLTFLCCGLIMQEMTFL